MKTFKVMLAVAAVLALAASVWVIGVLTFSGMSVRHLQPELYSAEKFIFRSIGVQAICIHCAKPKNECFLNGSYTFCCPRCEPDRFLDLTQPSPNVTQK